MDRGSRTIIKRAPYTSDILLHLVPCVTYSTPWLRLPPGVLSPWAPLREPTPAQPTTLGSISTASAPPSLVDSRLIAPTRARRSQQLVLLILFFNFAKKKSKYHHGGIPTPGPTLLSIVLIVAFEGNWPLLVDTRPPGGSTGLPEQPPGDVARMSVRQYWYTVFGQSTCWKGEGLNWNLWLILLHSKAAADLLGHWIVLWAFSEPFEAYYLCVGSDLSCGAWTTTSRDARIYVWIFMNMYECD